MTQRQQQEHDEQAALDEWVDTTLRTYTIRIRRDLRPQWWNVTPWSATVTAGIGIVHLAWRSRTRERLLRRVEKWIANDRLRNGDPRPPIIKIVEALPVPSDAGETVRCDIGGDVRPDPGPRR